MYKLRDKQTPYWFTNDEESRILKSLGAVFLEKVSVSAFIPCIIQKKAVTAD